MDENAIKELREKELKERCMQVAMQVMINNRMNGENEKITGENLTELSTKIFEWVNK
jgi:hypothetical protein